MGFQRQLGCWLRSSHTFKECVIAHYSREPAPKIIGAKTHHRSYGFITEVISGRGAYCKDEAKVRTMVDEAVERMPE